MGPLALFDKSFLEMLSVDQAVLFDLMFSTVISPIFYVEVLADLEKQDPKSRTREKIVADVARKTPVMHSYPNVSHLALCLKELLGSPVVMDGRPHIQGGIPVMHKGKVAIVNEQTPESKAFERWQDERFHDVERDFAASWRKALKEFDNSALATLTKQVLLIEEAPKNPEDALRIASAVLRRDGQHFLNLKLGYYFLGLDPGMWRAVEARWKASGYMPLTDYAPYFTYCLTIDIFFNLLMTKKIISPDRPSNRTDVAYLYYLPFCTLFISEDRLHRRIAPLFLKEGQKMVTGAELKHDLIKLDQHFSALPEEDRNQGMFRLAATPPDDEKYLTTRLWRECGHSTAPKPPIVENPAVHREISQNLKEVVALSRQPQRGRFSQSDLKEPDQRMIRRMIPRQWGKWQVIPDDIK
ncbi:hypothetical protein [Rhizobium leguminosarum]|uniref:hypothetical protein n=1 Tax=Rhizobium leguminosarum TaxID=384 RepID=UPI0024A9A3ED|nr:hypothetical protein [Rhizobium leguminosarum]MDI5929611.1 hypothetical protein [Rhizobium leguminosarum]